MQDLVGCDYFCTSAIFQGLDILVFIGGIWNFQKEVWGKD